MNNVISKKSDSHLIWIDLEMTGLDPLRDRIIEIATVITDKELNVIAEGPQLVIFQPDEILKGMDDWNQKQHHGSGLVAKIKESKIDERTAQTMTIQFLSQYLNPSKSPMCGNSICQDRRFLAAWMPDLEKFFHYRNLDVSTVKELAKRWAPEIYQGLKKDPKHLALADIYDSIGELKYYREKFFISAAI